MDFNTKFEDTLERYEIIEAIQSFDVEAVRILITRGGDIKRLSKDENLFWHLQRNLFSEATEYDLGIAGMIAYRLAKGNEMLKCLSDAGLEIIAIP